MANYKMYKISDKETNKRITYQFMSDFEAEEYGKKYKLEETTIKEAEDFFKWLNS